MRRTWSAAQLAALLVGLSCTAVAIQAADELEQLNGVLLARLGLADVPDGGDPLQSSGALAGVISPQERSQEETLRALQLLISHVVRQPQPNATLASADIVGAILDRAARLGSDEPLAGDNVTALVSEIASLLEVLPLQDTDSWIWSWPAVRRAIVAGIALHRHHSGPLASGAPLQAIARLLLALFERHRAAAGQKRVVEFAHVSKSGGTTLCQLAQKNGCQTESFEPHRNCEVQAFKDQPRYIDGRAHYALRRGGHTACDRPVKPMGFRRELSCDFRRAQLIRSNYTIYANEYTAQGGKEDPGLAHSCGNMLTVLQIRHPHDRALSHIRHVWRSYEEHCGDDRSIFFRGGHNMSTWSRLLPSPTNNYLIRSLLGESVFHLPSGDITESHLDLARTHLTQQYDVLLVLEDQDQSAQAMRYGLGWKAFELHANSAGEDAEDDGSPQDLQVLWDLNTLDLELYKYGVVMAALDAIMYDAVALMATADASAAASPSAGQSTSDWPQDAAAAAAAATAATAAAAASPSGTLQQVQGRLSVTAATSTGAAAEAKVAGAGSDPRARLARSLFQRSRWLAAGAQGTSAPGGRSPQGQSPGQAQRQGQGQGQAHVDASALRGTWIGGSGEHLKLLRRNRRALHRRRAEGGSEAGGAAAGARVRGTGSWAAALTRARQLIEATPQQTVGLGLAPGVAAGGDPGAGGGPQGGDRSSEPPLAQSISCGWVAQPLDARPAPALGPPIFDSSAAVRQGFSLLHHLCSLARSLLVRTRRTIVAADGQSSWTPTASLLNAFHSSRLLPALCKAYLLAPAPPLRGPGGGLDTGAQKIGLTLRYLDIMIRVLVYNDKSRDASLNTAVDRLLSEPEVLLLLREAAARAVAVADQGSGSGSAGPPANGGAGSGSGSGSGSHPDSSLPGGGWPSLHPDWPGLAGDAASARGLWHFPTLSLRAACALRPTSLPDPQAVAWWSEEVSEVDTLAHASIHYSYGVTLLVRCLGLLEIGGDGRAAAGATLGRLRPGAVALTPAALELACAGVVDAVGRMGRWAADLASAGDWLRDAGAEVLRAASYDLTLSLSSSLSCLSVAAMRVVHIGTQMELACNADALFVLKTRLAEQAGLPQPPAVHTLCRETCQRLAGLGLLRCLDTALRCVLWAGQQPGVRLAATPTEVCNWISGFLGEGCPLFLEGMLLQALGGTRAAGAAPVQQAEAEAEAEAEGEGHAETHQGQAAAVWRWLQCEGMGRRSFEEVAAAAFKMSLGAGGRAARQHEARPALPVLEGSDVGEGVETTGGQARAAMAAEAEKAPQAEAPQPSVHAPPPVPRQAAASGLTPEQAAVLLQTMAEVSSSLDGIRRPLGSQSLAAPLELSDPELRSQALPAGTGLPPPLPAAPWCGARDLGLWVTAAKLMRREVWAAGAREGAGAGGAAGSVVAGQTHPPSLPQAPESALPFGFVHSILRSGLGPGGLPSALCGCLGVRVERQGRAAAGAWGSSGGDGWSGGGSGSGGSSGGGSSGGGELDRLDAQAPAELLEAMVMVGRWGLPCLARSLEARTAALVAYGSAVHNHQHDEAEELFLAFGAITAAVTYLPAAELVASQPGRLLTAAAKLLRAVTRRGGSRPLSAGAYVVPFVTPGQESALSAGMITWGTGCCSHPGLVPYLAPTLAFAAAAVGLAAAEAAAADPALEPAALALLQPGPEGPSGWAKALAFCPTAAEALQQLADSAPAASGGESGPGSALAAAAAAANDVGRRLSGGQWEAMHALRRRLAAAVARSLPSGQPLYPPAALKLCANPHCANFAAEHEGRLKLRRCGGCEAEQYCGWACQQEAWQAGHRHTCKGWGSEGQ
ncbi:hypothetical protein HYH03_013242 [Edaphochlamys debaryana]|uniref:MYND-type domain-containing protein n=1 Tax=Edaphochlamys debaryana TaxID=47281 RepID=A0A835XNN3_9CHLO|nr:hypothetical protein HYH03_013242 [Edaphochlamys debaryana]|eukprot:KAG2488252.1 hypothetical protein HYH03_013242 [Edaphochlamys debaryana]